MAVTEQTIQTLEIVKEEEIAAPIEVVFETILEQLGPYNEVLRGDRCRWFLRRGQGGRWYRDLGNNMGHWWGSVQAIKSPTLVEICGPLFMSYPATSNLQYRLVRKTELRDFDLFIAQWAGFRRRSVTECNSVGFYAGQDPRACDA